MECEVVVVGGGIGGLTVAALLAQRGIDVCLLERESAVGGCAGYFEKFGYSFEQGYGLFRSWEPGEIHDRVFSELPVEPPEVRALNPAYQVRLPDGSRIIIGTDAEEFEEALGQAFPECADAAAAFYRKLGDIDAALRRASPSRTYDFLREDPAASELLKVAENSTADHLEGTSSRFRRFIDVQLQAFAQGTSNEVPYLRAALTLNLPRGRLFSIRGGGAALANRLAESIATSGSRIRLNTPVLRLSYNSTGAAVGVDLLSGETVSASRAIISNLTLWDTYGKLVGLNRTPVEVSKQLKASRGWGAYLLYLGLDSDLAGSSSADHVLALTDWQEGQYYNPELNQLLFAATPSWDRRAPQGKRAVTVHTFTDVEDWFTFHHDESEHEEQDQRMLELLWTRLHAAMPELGNSVEVIETATPRSFYDSTRRKLGMVWGTVPSPGSSSLNSRNHETVFPNLFIISDTIVSGGVDDLTRSALMLANRLSL